MYEGEITQECTQCIPEMDGRTSFSSEVVHD